VFLKRRRRNLRDTAATSTSGQPLFVRVPLARSRLYCLRAASISLGCRPRRQPRPLAARAAPYRPRRGHANPARGCPTLPPPRHRRVSGSSRELVEDSECLAEVAVQRPPVAFRRISIHIERCSKHIERCSNQSDLRSRLHPLPAFIERHDIGQCRAKNALDHPAPRASRRDTSAGRKLLPRWR
jgi:hypothetical protein